MLKPKNPCCSTRFPSVPEQLLGGASGAQAWNKVSLLRFRDKTHAEPAVCRDFMALEEPLQVSLLCYCPEQASYQKYPLGLTMRTPGHDLSLVIGLLFSQAIINDIDDIEGIQFVDDEGPQQSVSNHLEVQLAKGVVPDWPGIQRQFASYSSCGLCGKRSVQALALNHCGSIDSSAGWLEEHLLYQFPEQLRARQTLHPKTGAVHGAGYLVDGQWLVVEEDIGRHNALDKVLGQLLMQDCRSPRSVIVLSGRVSFELMQKVVRANIPVVVAVGAPSSLALAVARQFDISLIGFTKDQQFNVYHAPWRIKYKQVNVK